MITALSPGLTIRSEIIKALQADAALVALGVVIYPGKLPNKPKRPFFLIPTPAGRPSWQDGAHGGAEVSGVGHAFTAPTDVHPDAEEFAAALNGHFIRIVGELDVVVEDVAVSIHPTLDQVIRDGEEADAWHGMVNYDASAT